MSDEIDDAGRKKPGYPTRPGIVRVKGGVTLAGDSLPAADLAAELAERTRAARELYRLLGEAQLTAGVSIDKTLALLLIRYPWLEETT